MEDNNYSKVKSVTLSMPIRNIKKDLVKLKEKYSFIRVADYPFTRVFKEQIYQDFNEWLEHWQLEGFRFKLIFNEHQITFEPIRDIDKYVIIGIMTAN